mmetsp:Transcript_79288/g.256984  ORF Transcript_79288/g.256984 Transcript_79288/m.256984 type:complete len:365 (-) Transcript_79288:2-1096(-)
MTGPNTSTTTPSTHRSSVHRTDCKSIVLLSTSPRTTSRPSTTACTCPIGSISLSAGSRSGRPPVAMTGAPSSMRCLRSSFDSSSFGSTRRCFAPPCASASPSISSSSSSHSSAFTSPGFATPSVAAAATAAPSAPPTLPAAAAVPFAAAAAGAGALAASSSESVEARSTSASANSGSMARPWRDFPGSAPSSAPPITSSGGEGTRSIARAALRQAARTSSLTSPSNSLGKSPILAVNSLVCRNKLMSCVMSKRFGLRGTSSAAASSAKACSCMAMRWAKRRSSTTVSPSTTRSSSWPKRRTSYSPSLASSSSSSSSMSPAPPLAPLAPRSAMPAPRTRPRACNAGVRTRRREGAAAGRRDVWGA